MYGGRKAILFIDTRLTEGRPYCLSVNVYNGSKAILFVETYDYWKEGHIVCEHIRLTEGTPAVTCLNEWHGSA